MDIEKALLKYTEQVILRKTYCYVVTVIMLVIYWLDASAIRIYPWCFRRYGVSGRSQNSRKA